MTTKRKRLVLIGLAAVILAVGVLGATGTLTPHGAAAGFNSQLQNGTDGGTGERR